MGHWEALAADKRLGLESKLEAAAVEKRGKAYQPPEELKDLPKGVEFHPHSLQFMMTSPSPSLLWRLSGLQVSFQVHSSGEHEPLPQVSAASLGGWKLASRACHMHALGSL